MYTAVMQVVIKAATTVVMALKQAEIRPTTSANMANVGEVTKTLKSKTCKLNEDEKVPIMKNWLKREGL